MEKIWILIAVFSFLIVLLVIRKSKECMETTQKIPKQIFMTYKFEYDELNKIIKDNIENTKYLNPEYEIKYYSDSEAEKFILENFPEYINDYKSIVPGAYKADLIRLLLLYKYGGVYNDIGHMYIQPIRKFISHNDTLIVCKDQGLQGFPLYYLLNSIIACTPNHNMIKKAIDVIIENIRNKFYGNNALDPTGPGAFGKAFNIYFGRKDEEIIDVGMFNEETKVMNHPLKNTNHPGFIENIDGTQIIKTKFDNYYEIVYEDNQNDRYVFLWDQKRIYL